MNTKIEKITPKGNGRIIAVSDVHGCVTYLEGLLRKIYFTK